MSPNDWSKPPMFERNYGFEQMKTLEDICNKVKNVAWNEMSQISHYFDIWKETSDSTKSGLDLIGDLYTTQTY